MELRDEHGATPLIYAASYGCTESVRLLMKAGAKLNTPDYDGMVCYAMVRYGMLCYAMVRYDMVRYAMVCMRMLCYALVCYGSYTMLCQSGQRADGQQSWTFGVCVGVGG